MPDKLKGISLEIGLEVNQFKSNLNEVKRQLTLAKDNVELFKKALEKEPSNKDFLDLYKKALEDFGNLAQETRDKYNAAFNEMLNKGYSGSDERLKALTKEMTILDGSTARAINTYRKFDEQISFAQGDLSNVAPILNKVSNEVKNNDTLMIGWGGTVHKSFNEFAEGIDYLDTEVDVFDDAMLKVQGITREFVDTIADADDEALDSTGFKTLAEQTEEFSDATEGANNDSNIFFANLKANLLSEAISKGLELLKDGLEAVWQGIKKLASGYTDLMKQGIEYDALIQGYTATLSSYLGDNDTAEKIVKDVRQIGIEFGFANDRLLEMAQTLVVSGVSVDDTKKTINGVVSALSVFGKGNAELSRVSTNLLQIQTNGRATARDLREFANAGIPIYKMLADYSDEFVGDFQATDVQLEDILGAFEYAMEDENNILSKAGEIRKSTFNGQLDALEARWQEFLGNMALDTTGTLTTEVLPAINEFLTTLINAFNGDENGENGGMGAVAIAFSEGLGSLINTISESGILEQFIEGATMIMNAIGTAFDPNTDVGKANLEALENLLDTMLGLLVDFITSEEIMRKFIEAGITIAKAFVGAFWDYVKSNIEFDLGDINDTDFRSVYDSGGFSSGGFGALQSGGFNSGGLTSNLNIYITNNADNITESVVRGWADIINEQLGQMV